MGEARRRRLTAMRNGEPIPPIIAPVKQRLFDAVAVPANAFKAEYEAFTGSLPAAKTPGAQQFLEEAVIPAGIAYLAHLRKRSARALVKPATSKDMAALKAEAEERLAALKRG